MSHPTWCVLTLVLYEPLSHLSSLQMFPFRSQSPPHPHRWPCRRLSAVRVKSRLLHVTIRTFLSCQIPVRLLGMNFPDLLVNRCSLKNIIYLTTAQDIRPKYLNIVNSSFRLNVVSITLISNSRAVLLELTVGMLAAPAVHIQTEMVYFKWILIQSLFC